MTAVRAEWTKLRTTPGPAWLLVLTAAVTVALGIAVSDLAAGPRDATRLALSGVYLGQVPVAVLGVLVMGGEYGTALIGVTLAAVPNRPVVLAAKAVVLSAAVAATGGVTLLFALLAAGRLSSDGPTLRAGLGSVAYLVLIAVLSLGVATVVRDSGAAIGAVLGLLYLPPVLTQLVTDPDVHRRLDQAAPMSAGLSIQATTDLHRLPLGPWAGLAVLAAWATGSLLAGGFLLRNRDSQ